MLPKHANKSLFWLLTTNFVLFGASMTVFGATIPEIIREYEWTYSAAGVVLAASAVGYFTSTFISGFAVRIAGPKLVVCLTLVLEGAAFLFFARHPSVLLNVFLNFLIGFGQGGTEVISNVVVIQIERDGKSRLMNLLHAGFCVGAFLGPMGVAGLLSSRIGWGAIFPAIGVIILGIALVLGFQKYPKANAESHETRVRVQSGRRLLISLYIAIILLYVGVELSMSNWSAEYFVTHLGSSSGTGALMVAVLWIGLFVGRMGLSLFYHGTRQELVLLYLTAASSGFILLLLLSSSIVASVIWVFLIGVGLSGVYPLVMSLVGKSSQSTVAVGLVSTGGGIGSFSFPFILALIADSAGLHRAFYYCLGVAVLMTIVTALVVLIRKLQTAPSSRGPRVPENDSDTYILR